ncbi:MAG: hypothetical protein KJ823_10760 [Proteobacteria bacterium]|nr:hypothetical protein [Pseudomonadota bacterium]
MADTYQGIFVEIVAKKKGCVLCDLAIAILEEISPEFGDDMLKWDVVDIGDRGGIRRFDELTGLCGRRPAVPSIVINERIAFDNIPDYEALSGAVREASRTQM